MSIIRQCDQCALCLLCVGGVGDADELDGAELFDAVVHDGDAHLPQGVEYLGASGVEFVIARDKKDGGVEVGQQFEGFLCAAAEGIDQIAGDEYFVGVEAVGLVYHFSDEGGVH